MITIVKSLLGQDGRKNSDFFLLNGNLFAKNSSLISTFSTSEYCQYITNTGFMQFSVFQNKITSLKRGGWAYYYKSFVMFKRLDKFLKMKILHFWGAREWITYCEEGKEKCGKQNMLKHKGNLKRFNQ